MTREHVKDKAEELLIILMKYVNQTGIKDEEVEAIYLELAASLCVATIDFDHYKTGDALHKSMFILDCMCYAMNKYERGGLENCQTID